MTAAASALAASTVSEPVAWSTIEPRFPYPVIDRCIRESGAIRTSFVLSIPVESLAAITPLTRYGVEPMTSVVPTGSAVPYRVSARPAPSTTTRRAVVRSFAVKPVPWAIVDPVTLK